MKTTLFGFLAFLTFSSSMVALAETPIDLQFQSVQKNSDGSVTVLKPKFYYKGHHRDIVDPSMFTGPLFDKSTQYNPAANVRATFPNYRATQEVFICKNILEQLGMANNNSTLVRSSHEEKCEGKYNVVSNLEGTGLTKNLWWGNQCDNVVYEVECINGL